jgi:Ca-activated chloride channel homolog
MMLNWLLIILSLVLTDPAKIGQINKAKSEAKKAFLAEDYATAAKQYQYLADSLDVREDEVLLNLAHAYYQLNDTAQALSNYQSATASSKASVRSTAQHQMGVIKNKQGKFEEALNHFKEAIKADPANDDARYNYELLKRKLDEQKKQEQQQQQDQNKDKQQDQQQKDQQKKDEQKKDQDKQDQEKKDQEKQDDQQKKEDQKDKQQKDQQQNQEQKEDEQQKENKPSSEKLEQMKISEEKAKMILEAMKNQEIQYLQQNKRKATQPKDKNKPDW